MDKTVLVAIEGLGEGVLRAGVRLFGARTVLVTTNNPEPPVKPAQVVLSTEAGWRNRLRLHVEKADYLLGLAAMEEWRRAHGAAIAGELSRRLMQLSVLVLAADPMRAEPGLPTGLAAEVADYALTCFDGLIWEAPTPAEQLEARPLPEIFSARLRRAGRLTEHLSACCNTPPLLTSSAVELKWLFEKRGLVMAGLSEEEAPSLEVAAASAAADLRRRLLKRTCSRLVVHLLVKRTESLKALDEAVKKVAEPFGFERGDVLVLASLQPSAAAPSALVLAAR